MIKFTILITFFLLLSINLFSQTTSPMPPEKDNDDVVKISTTLIQVDVSVTDKKGRQVLNLKPEDFEILENGKTQRITNFSYIASVASSTENSVEASGKTNSKDKNVVIVPPVNLRPEQVRRTFALIVDDLGLSFSTIGAVKSALKKFVDEQMQPNDLVSIIRTSNGAGVLQQFTSDKRILYTAIERIRWYAGGKGNIDSFKSADPGDDTSPSFYQLQQDTFTVGTLGTINSAISGMREMPGRKAILLFSEGFNLFESAKQLDGGGSADTRINTGSGSKINESSVGGINTRLANSLARMIESANRASVVIYGVDARGVVSTLPDAYDVSAGSGAGGKFGAGYGIDTKTIVNDRSTALIESQRGLRYISEQTGGFAVINNNNLSKGVEKALSDQNGYYLIGYQPDDEAFDSKTSRYNKLTIKVKDSDLNVRYRSGFFGIEDKKPTTAERTPTQQVISALTSPFKSSEINLSLNTVLISDSNNAALIRSIIYIDVKDLNFTKEADGRRKANIDIVAVTFGDNGLAVEQFAKNYTILVSEEKYQNILRSGLVYDLPVPIRKIGTYQFRVAIRDSNSQKIGSASNLVQVPDLARDFALSGIVLDNVPNKKPATIQNSSKNLENSADQPDIYLNMSLRRFKRQTALHYGYLIYNPKLDSKQKPQLEIQTKLFFQGKMIFQTNPVMLNVEGQTDLQHIENIGLLTLGNNLQIGDYVLQVIVRDKTGKDKKQIISQWIDFEIID